MFGKFMYFISKLHHQINFCDSPAVDGFCLFFSPYRTVILIRVMRQRKCQSTHVMAEGNHRIWRFWKTTKILFLVGNEWNLSPRNFETQLMNRSRQRATESGACWFDLWLWPQVISCKNATVASQCRQVRITVKRICMTFLIISVIFCHRSATNCYLGDVHQLACG